MIDLAWWDFAALEGLRADDRLRVLSRDAAARLLGIERELLAAANALEGRL